MSIWLQFVYFTDGYYQNLNETSKDLRENIKTQKAESGETKFKIKLSKSDQELLDKLDLEHQEKLRKLEMEQERKKQETEQEKVRKQEEEKMKKQAESKGKQEEEKMKKQGESKGQVTASPNPKSKLKVFQIMSTLLIYFFVVKLLCIICVQ